MRRGVVFAFCITCALCILFAIVNEMFDISLTHWPATTVGRTLADLVEMIRNDTYQGINNSSLTDNTSLEYVSLFYRVDIKGERRLSIKGGPTEYLVDYKNPCWLAALTDRFPYESNVYRTAVERYPGGRTYSVEGTFREMSKIFAKRLKEGDRWRLRCLPYVYLIGVTKSGTTDLFENILEHPQVIPGALKEPMWWNRHSIGRERELQIIPYTFSDYVDLYDAAAEEIRNRTTMTESGTAYHPIVTIDGSPAYLWDYDGWQMIPGNIGLQEPRYILAHSLKALVPDAKIVVIVRHPVDRLYSQFRMKWPHASTRQFHDSAKEAIKQMNKCLEKRTLRSCVYDARLNPTEFKRQSPNTGHVFLRVSIYCVYIADWMSVFGPDQLLVLRAEDYYSNRTEALSTVYKFLGLAALDPVTMRAIEEKRVINDMAANKRTAVPMRADTRALLTGFYKRYNEMLALLLDDDRFLWNDR